MKKIFLVCSFWVWLVPMAIAQGTISGKVTDLTTNQPLPGVNILLKGTQVGAITDADGNYRIEVPGENAVLIFSFIGYETIEERIGNRTVIDVALATDAQQLNEVVVTALGIKREKRALGYAISELSGEDLSVAQEANPINSLSGKVAGVDISTSTAGYRGHAAYRY